MPEEIASAVRDFRDCKRTHIGPPDIADVVTVANFLDAQFYPVEGETLECEAPTEALEHLKLDLEKIQTLMEETKEELALIFTAIS